MLYYLDISNVNKGKNKLTFANSIYRYILEKVTKPTTKLKHYITTTFFFLNLQTFLM